MSDDIVTRAKFRVTEEHRSVHQPDQVQVILTAVTADEVPENKRFHKYTPGGKLELWVNNPAVKLELDKTYYLDFTLADQ